MGGVFLAEASSKPPQVMPARVSVQDPAFGGVGAGMNRHGDPALQRDEAFVASRQCSGGDHDAAEMRENLARGQLVERFVRDGSFVAADLLEQDADLRAREPEHGAGGAFGSGQCLVEGDEVLPDCAGVAAKEVAYQLVERASLAGAGAELPCGAADRAAAPEVRIRVGALRAQRRVPGAAADVVDGAAAAAWCPPQLAPVAPGFVRDPGNLTDRCPSADAAPGGGSWPAVGATGSVGKADGDFLVGARSRSIPPG